jgi:hypothetical protein
MPKDGYRTIEFRGLLQERSIGNCWGGGCLYAVRGIDCLGRCCGRSHVELERRHSWERRTTGLRDEREGVTTRTDTLIVETKYFPLQDYETIDGIRDEDSLRK